MNTLEFKKYLRSYSDWFSLGDGKPASSLDFIHRKNNKVLYFFAGNHNNNPKDPQINRLDNFLKKFESETSDKKVAYVTEQDFDKDALVSKEQSITDYVGEMGYILYLSKQKNIESYCFEPSEKNVIDNLALDFEKKHLFYYLFAEWLSWLDSKPNNFNKKATGVREDISNSLGWENFDFSLNTLKETHLELFKSALDPFDIDFFKSIAKPSYTNTLINKISREYTAIRDAYVIKGILDLWNKDYNLFVVYGLGHAFVQKPALEKLLK